jgi:hypothetical protein
MVALQHGTEGPANRSVEPWQLTEGAGFSQAAHRGCRFLISNSIRKLNNFVKLVSEEVLKGVNILESVYERGVLTLGRHVETGSVWAQWLIAVWVGRVVLKASAFLVRHGASAWLAVP